MIHVTKMNRIRGAGSMRLSIARRRVVDQVSPSIALSPASFAGEPPRAEKPRPDKLSPARAMRLGLFLAVAAWVPVIALLYLIFG